MALFDFRIFFNIMYIVFIFMGQNPQPATLSSKCLFEIKNNI